MFPLACFSFTTLLFFLPSLSSSSIWFLILRKKMRTGEDFSFIFEIVGGFSVFHERYSHHGIFLYRYHQRPCVGLYSVKTNEKRWIPAFLNFLQLVTLEPVEFREMFSYGVKVKSAVGPSPKLPTTVNSLESLNISKVKDIIILMSNRKNYRKRVILLVFELLVCL